MREIITLPELPPEEQIGRDTAKWTYSRGWTREVVTNGCDICLSTALDGEHVAHRSVNYVKWGGSLGVLPATHSLGISAAPIGQRGYFSDALFHAAFGYVNGFPTSAIVYFLLTRCLPPRRVQKRIARWEAKRR